MDSIKRFIVVTGVSRGLGRAMVERFIESGHTVAGCARSQSTIASMNETFGPAHQFSSVDLSDWQQVQRWAKQLTIQIGTPDLLINAAALINKNAPLWEVPNEEFSQVIDVNIKGVFHTIQSFVPAMVNHQRGVVVNFSSYWGRSTSADVATYCATKWAIEGLSRGLADDLPSGLASVALNPGVIHTEMLETCFGEHAGSYPTPAEWATTAVPYMLELSELDNGKSLTVPGF